MVKCYAWCLNTKFWQLGYRMYCNTDYIAAEFDALRSTIGRIAMSDFSEYALMVTNCI